MSDLTSFNLDNYYTEFGGLASNGFFSRKKYIKLDDPKIEELKSSFFKKYCEDQYQCIYFYEDINDIDHCKIYGNLYFDLDGNVYTLDGFSKIRNDVLQLLTFFLDIGLKESEIELYFSGAKGFHVIIPAKVLGIIPSTNLNELYKAWAQYLAAYYSITSLDMGIYDRKRLLRIPGTVNSKTGLKKTRISHELIRESNSFREMLFKLSFLDADIPDIHEEAMNEPAAIEFYKRSQNYYRNARNNHNTNRPARIPEHKEELLPCIKAGLEMGAPVGNRNNTLVILSSAILQSGYKLEEAIEVMLEWNTHNEQELKTEEIELTVRSAYTMLLSGKKYGCGALKELGYCIGDKCKIEIERRKDT